MIIKIQKLPQELFVDVKGFEGYYLVSNLGRIASLRKPKGNGVLREEALILKSWNAGGYECVFLQKNGMRIHKSVHRIVAEAFLPNPANLPMVNHKDKNKKNNRVDNLEWCDAKYNVNYSKDEMKDRSKAIKVTSLKTNKSLYFVNELVLNQLCHFTQRIVRQCCRGLRDNAYGCKFEFVEER